MRPIAEFFGCTFTFNLSRHVLSAWIMNPLWPFFVFRLFYLFVYHFFDKHYAATSYGDRFSSVLLQLNFALQHHVRRQTWFSHGEFILASLLQATVNREYYGIGHTYGTYIGGRLLYYELFSPLGRNGHPTVHDWRHSGSAQSDWFLSSQTMLHRANSPYDYLQYLHLQRRSPRTLGQRSEQRHFSAHRKSYHGSFAFWLLALEMEDLPLLTSLKINFQRIQLLLPQLFLHWAPASQLIQLLFCQLESGTTPSAPASAITNGIPANQPRALAQGLQSLASWRPTDSGACEAAS